MLKTIDQIADAVHALAHEKGFHFPQTDEEFLANQCNNMTGEVSELWEACRCGKLRQPCDKADKMESMGLKPLTCIEEEYADIVIRALDACRRLGVDIQLAVEVKHAYNKTRPFRHGKKN